MTGIQDIAAQLLTLCGQPADRPRPLLLAIDGRCAAGKTSLAAALQQAAGCSVLHMDHFFLRPAQRTAARLAEPGGNIDHERFLEQALLPLLRGQACRYQPYDCRKQALAAPVLVEPTPLCVIEGAYACHPALWEHYDHRVFLSVAPEEQMARIRRRNGAAAAERFRTQWIPLEERYFAAFSVAERCALHFETG